MDVSTGKSWKNFFLKNAMVRYDSMKSSQDIKERKVRKVLNQQNKCSFNMKYLENY